MRSAAALCGVLALCLLAVCRFSNASVIGVDLGSQFMKVRPVGASLIACGAGRLSKWKRSDVCSAVLSPSRYFT
eukprot:scaffold707_cov240-Pinguiococcus_pyrenoidosus.AAC.11